VLCWDDLCFGTYPMCMGVFVCVCVGVGVGVGVGVCVCVCVCVCVLAEHPVPDAGCCPRNRTNAYER
jgi:hypothetical protein